MGETIGMGFTTSFGLLTYQDDQGNDVGYLSDYQTWTR